MAIGLGARYKFFTFNFYLTDLDCPKTRPDNAEILLQC